MFSRINVKKIFIFLDTFIYVCVDRVFYKPKCTEAQIFVNIWGTNWLQTGKEQLLGRDHHSDDVHQHLRSFCMKRSHFGPCQDANHSTARDHGRTCTSLPRVLLLSTISSTLTVGEVVPRLTPSKCGKGTSENEQRLCYIDMLHPACRRSSGPGR